MRAPGFGDRVRIVTAPETVASGFAGRVGEVWGEAAPGKAPALSVFFEGTEELAWFPSRLVQRVRPRRSPADVLPIVLVTALALAAAAVAAAVLQSPVRRLTLVSAATPCLPVPGYATSGLYPAVLGVSKRATRTNLALRSAVVADQLRFARTARRHMLSDVTGSYETGIDPGLTSASTAVVSALLPVQELSRSGAGGETWIAVTVAGQSGRTVTLSELLARAPLALPRLVSVWKSGLKGTALWARIAGDPAGYTPTLAHYRLFALTPKGLAFGFPQSPDGPRFAALVPYRLVQPYLSRLGRRLVAGVRRPRPAPDLARAGLEWTSLQSSPSGVARIWPLACT